MSIHYGEGMSTSSLHRPTLPHDLFRSGNCSTGFKVRFLLVELKICEGPGPCGSYSAECRDL